MAHHRFNTSSPRMTLTALREPTSAVAAMEFATTSARPHSPRRTDLPRALGLQIGPTCRRFVSLSPRQARQSIANYPRQLSPNPIQDRAYYGWPIRWDIKNIRRSNSGSWVDNLNLPPIARRRECGRKHEEPPSGVGLEQANCGSWVDNFNPRDAVAREQRSLRAPRQEDTER